MTSRPSTSTKKKDIKAKVSAGMFTLDQQESSGLRALECIFNYGSQTSSSLMAGVYALIANLVVVPYGPRAERATGAGHLWNG